MWKLWKYQFRQNIIALNSRVRELRNIKQGFNKKKQDVIDLVPWVQQVCIKKSLDNDLYYIIIYILLEYLVDDIKDDFRKALDDIIIPINDIDSYCTNLKVCRGKLLQEHNVDNISLSIPPDVMGNREKWGEKMSCSQIMLFSNGNAYYDHPECCTAIHSFYEPDDIDTDESSMIQFIKWLYEHNYVE